MNDEDLDKFLDNYPQLKILLKVADRKTVREVLRKELTSGNLGICYICNLLMDRSEFKDHVADVHGNQVVGLDGPGGISYNAIPPRDFPFTAVGVDADSGEMVWSFVAYGPGKFTVPGKPDNVRRVNVVISYPNRVEVSDGG